MPPIRVGIVGLSSKPGAWATLAHLPRLASSPNFQIVALFNKSVRFPEKLAADPNVDLFVVSTRVDTHYAAVKPALEAGKNVYVEWPLAASVPQAEELVSLAKKTGVKAIIGLQGRVSPTVLKVKELVESGRLGNVHSINVQAASGTWQNNAASARYYYFLDRKIGGNLLTIYGGHILDSVLFAVGELKPGGYQAISGNLRPKMHVMQEDGSLSKEIYDKDVPDQILLQGRIDRSPPAVFSFHLRAGDRFKDEPGSTWRIYGDKAELKVEFTSAGPQIGAARSMKICTFETGEVETIAIDEGGKEWTDLPTPAQNIGRLYEAYAAGKGYGDWELALKRHKLIEEFFTGME